MNVLSLYLLRNTQIPSIRICCITYGSRIFNKQPTTALCTVSPQEDPSSKHEAPIILQPTSRSSATNLRIKKISKAMQAYLERARNYETFVTMKEEEYEIGKHHLANMMGVEVGEMTQEAINKAIEYLLPSGLYEPLARPVMKSPREMYPKEKAAQFDDSGRPFSPFFYTGKANFYQAIHDAVVKFRELDELEDKMIRKGITSVPDEKLLDLSGSEFVSIEKLSEMFLEKINEFNYRFFIETFTRLAQHPYAFRCRDFIWKFRKDFEDVSKVEDIPELMYDENGRPYIDSKGLKRTTSSKVRIWGNGTGKISINGKDISFFQILQDKEQILFPLEYSGMLGKVDVEATVEEGGTSTMASSVRYAIALGLRSMVSEEIREKMRLAGLLTVDVRTRERKKPGQTGARAKYKWVKR